MEQRKLYSITEARKLLGGISRNSIYGLLNSGALCNVIIGRRRFIAAAAISEFIEASTSRAAPWKDPLRKYNPGSRIASASEGNATSMSGMTAGSDRPFCKPQGQRGPGKEGDTTCSGTRS